MGTGAGASEPGERPAASRAHVGGRNLPLAIAVGLGLAAVFLGSLFWHPAAFSLVVAVLTVLAYVEAARVLDRVGVRLQLPVLLVTTALMLYGAYQAGHGGQAVGVAALALGAILWPLTERARIDVVRTVATTLLFGLWVGFLASFGVLLITGEDGAIVVLGVVGAAVLSDIGGYGFGVAFGRRRIAPSVSPNKTWEGFLGGLLVATLLAMVVMPAVSTRFTVAAAAVLALVCGSAAFLGDLVESMVKRDLGVKDLGDLLPGHGGVLDRVDGILFALPIGYYAVEVLTRSAA